MSKVTSSKQSAKSRIYKEYKGFVVFLILMSMFRSAFADWSDVPTGSMEPTIAVGDRILINKMAYDIRIPFTHHSLVKMGEPVHGDIIVFDSKVSNLRLVKRVVGIPGDTVSLSNNRLTINGQSLTYQLEAQSEDAALVQENLLGVKHTVTLSSQPSTLANFQEITIPANFYLAMGDNRDNSADSRVIGLVPRDEIIGRAKTVVLSLDYENYFLPRPERFFHTL